MPFIHYKNNHNYPLEFSIADMLHELAYRSKVGIFCFRPPHSMSSFIDVRDIDLMQSVHSTPLSFYLLSVRVYTFTSCSAGVGRTGTFITIDAMMQRLQEKDDLNIYQFVTAMRTRRTFMVQTMVSG